jgi:hypothetical protein
MQRQTQKQIPPLRYGMTNRKKRNYKRDGFVVGECMGVDSRLAPEFLPGRVGSHLFAVPC